ncbi:MAG: alanine--tRNA ligase-related protein [Candidatus Heimdallarchaeaceae archaeon]
MNGDIPLYWKAPYQKKILAKITAIRNNEIQLNQELFYPGGGGQPPDNGTLRHYEDEYEIKEAYKDGTGIWLKIKEKLGENISIGEEVLLNLNWERRYALMKAHTAQHLVSYFFKSRFNRDTLKANFGMEHMEIELSNVLPMQDIFQVINLSNQLISEGGEVKSIIVEQETYKEKYRNKTRGKKSQEETVRLIQLGEKGFDLVCCGGVHVKNLRELNCLVLESVKNQFIKIFVDNRAISFANQQREIMLKLEEITTKKGEKLIELVSNKLKINELLEEGNVKLLRLLLQNIKNITEEIGTIDVAFLSLPEIDRKTIQAAAKSLTSNTLAVIIGSNNTLFFIASDDEIQLDKISKEIKEKVGLKGGGNKAFAQFHLDDTRSSMEAIREMVFNILKQIR